MPECSNAGNGVTIGVIGLGLIGGSVGLSLRSPERTVIGCDPSPEAEALATSRMCVDRIAPFEEVAQADFVFIAAPPEHVIPTAERVLELAAPEAVITDCASVKVSIANWAAEKKATQFVGGHPMAGHEKSGAGFASGWLFRNARWLLTPTKHTSKSALRSLETLLKSMGATPIRVDAAEHDRHVAILSHLPHVLAALLVLEGDSLERTEIGAGSWRDATRVGGVDPELWTQIMLGNAPELARVSREFAASLVELANVLESGDREGLQKMLVQAQAAKKKQDALAPSPAAQLAKGAKRRR